ncbi:uncharacterized protein Z518_06468 [Rhinocladiella mackenziei CBS 650.93]|uniref:Fungal-type protein kinase domain-containing protein n=1 Tax=Rhinocladiella mackenziei CBS 650.93 TaxID=1442369 RepID=A0A0D2IR11_9EURO|nr:uncharacterized protein Z518_06468 [Rhinocladiella mackenziei CBS 650.93]KIX05596.1 hypothetical protein Z518_06468 [Rhinocladiella mackenziei CBS 650.93]
MNPPTSPSSRPRRKAAEKALKDIHNIYGRGTKRLRATLTQREKKVLKRTRNDTPPRTFSQGDNTPAQYKPTPTHKYIANHSGLVEEDDVVYVDEIEIEILVEACGITRKNIPCDIFRSTFLGPFKHKDERPQLKIQAIKNVGIGNWEQASFFQRLQKALPKKWLRSAWNIFYYQPFRRYLYGILFLQPYALITYVDHGCAGYSEPLDFVENLQHTQFLADFLADLIAEPEYRGRDPHITAHRNDGSIFIEHAGIKWAEVFDGLLCYRPCVFTRHLRVTRVHPIDFPEDKWVMKNSWEEMLKNPSPPPEEEVLRILIEANVRGLPQLHESCRSTTGRSDNTKPLSDKMEISSDNMKVSSDNIEVLTSHFPSNCENVLAAITNRTIILVKSDFVSKRTSKSNLSDVSAGTTGTKFLFPVKVRKQSFNEYIDVRRRRTCLITSYCQPLKEAMRNARPKELMRTIRDAMIVYYEAYKRPEYGFLHGDISTENIMVPVEETQLTGGLTHKTLRGTLIDWNLCFTADGRASSRGIRSGTPTFMAPSLLLDEPVTRRTLGHDMESFFAVMLWIASINYDDDIAFQSKPLVKHVVGNKSSAKFVAHTKLHLFENPKAFKMSIINYFEQPYRKDNDFVECTWDLRHVLYKQDYDEDTLSSSEEEPTDFEGTNDDDPMKERLFKDCMAVFDKHLGDEGKQSGSYQLDKIDAREDPEESDDEF